MYVIYFVDSRKGFTYTGPSGHPAAYFLVTRPSDSVWIVPGTVSPLDD